MGGGIRNHFELSFQKSIPPLDDGKQYKMSIEYIDYRPIICGLYNKQHTIVRL